MDPRKNARRGYRERAMRRRNAALGQNVFAVQRRTGNMNAFWRTIIVVALVCMTVLCLGLMAVTFFASRPIESVVAPTNTPLPVMPTEEVVATPVPATMSCSTPSIKASLDGSNWTEQGEFLDTVLGKRMTFTNRKVVVPSKAWNDPLTPDELKLVEQTWVKIQICVVEGQNAILFAGGLEQSLNRYENGILLSLKPGLYEFSLRNGEAVIWYPNQETFSKKDLDRIFDQIRMGNFDVKAPLAFFGVSADLLPKVPDDLVKQRNVQVVPSLDPMVK